MWPKALAQLIELAPHITRLVPLADRLIQSKSASDETNQHALDTMTDKVREDLGRVAASHANIHRQLNEQGEKLYTIAAEVRTMRSLSETTEARMTSMEQKVSTTNRLLIIAVFFDVVLVVLVALLTYLYVHHN